MITLQGSNTINGLSFAEGAYYGDKINGTQCFIMQSAENADKVIADFEEGIARGLDPNSIIDTVLANRGLTEKDFTDSDINRINKRVEAIYRLMKNKRYY